MIKYGFFISFQYNNKGNHERNQHNWFIVKKFNIKYAVRCI